MSDIPTLESIKASVRTAFQENVSIYPEYYPISSDGYVTQSAFNTAYDFAENLFECRDIEQEKHETKLGITVDDYQRWVERELITLKLVTKAG